MANQTTASLRLFVATHNAHKLGEMAAILPGFDIQADDPDVEETAETFAGNALLKVRAIAARHPGAWCLADDSGLEVFALGGAPGVRSARYAGEPSDTPKNNALLLKNLADETDRRARFVCCCALVAPDGAEHVVEGFCPGVIAREPSGEGGFGYDPLFVPDGFTQSFAALGAAEKNRISHRGRSLAAVRKIILGEKMDLNDVAQALEKRGFEVTVCATREAAAARVMAVAAEAATIGQGGSMTLKELGLPEALAAVGKAPARKTDVDLFLLSANALTADGRIVNIDGNGNRVAASINGPKKVLYVIGRNKIVAGGLDAAVARIKKYACPPNCRRLGKQTPCAATGICADCDSPDRICKVTAVFERRPTGIAGEVVLVDEDLGY